MNYFKQENTTYQDLKKYFLSLLDKPARRQRLAGKSFEASKVTRLTESWNSGLHNELNSDIRSGKKRIDERAEDLIKNNPYVSGHLLRETANVVGSEGFRLQVESKLPDGKLDEFANSFIERKFKEWCRKEYCTMHGRLSFIRLQWMIVNTMFASGEYLIRKVKNVSLDENPFAFSLEILYPRDIDILYSKVISEDRIVLMGVEIDKWRKVKRIYLKPNKLRYEVTYSNTDLYNQAQREFINAEDMYFDFDSVNQYTVKQVRGYTPLTAAMLLMRSIDLWETSSLTNAILSARKMGFLIRKNMEGEQYVGTSTANKAGDEKEKQDPDGGKYMDFSEGSIEELPFGYEFEGWNPRYPHEQHEPFLKANLRKYASKFGVNYNSTFNDYAGVTFSSLRAGALDERDIWKIKQTLIRESFLVSLYPDWLHWALLSQALAPLQFQNKERYIDHSWMPKRWAWVKPLEDVKAKVASVANFFESPIQVAAELGNNFEEIIRDVEKVKNSAERLGVKPDWLLNLMLIPKSNNDTEPVDLNKEINPDEEDTNELRLIEQAEHNE